MKPSTVVFDLDGTLLDSMTSIPLAYVETIRELGGPKLTPRQLTAAWHLGPTPVVLAHFLGRTTAHSDMECFHRHVATAAETIQPFEGVPELLQTLRHDGYTLAVYTSAIRPVATPMLTRTGLTEHFTTVVTGDQVTTPKPAPDGLLHTCRLLNIPASAAAYVGDAATDLDCARAAETMAIHARWSTHTEHAPGFPHVAYQPADVITLLTAAHAQSAP